MGALSIKNKRVVVAGKIGVAISGIYFIYLKIDVHEIAVLLMDLSPGWIVLAALFLTASKVVSAYRTRHFLRCLHIDLEIADSIKLCFVGLYYNTFLPGSVGGDLYRAYYLHTRTARPLKKLAILMLADRVVGACAIVVLVLGIIFLMEFNSLPTQLLALAAMFVFSMLFFLGFSLFFSEFLPVLMITSWISIFVQLLQVISCFAILNALGIESQHDNYIILFLISSVASILPVSFGGIGLREATFLMLPGVLNLDIDVHSGIALASVFFVINVISSIPGAFIPLRKEINQLRVEI